LAYTEEEHKRTLGLLVPGETTEKVIESRPKKPQNPVEGMRLFCYNAEDENKTGANGMLKPQVQLRLTEDDGLYDLIVNKTIC